MKRLGIAEQALDARRRECEGGITIVRPECAHLALDYRANDVGGLGRPEIRAGEEDGQHSKAAASRRTGSLPCGPWLAAAES